MAGPVPDFSPWNSMPFTIGGVGDVDHDACYGIAFVTGARGTDVVEFRPPMLCFALPGQAPAWRRARGLEGTAILFTDEFLESYPRDKDVLRALGCAKTLELSRKDSAALVAVTREMEEEYRLRAPGCRAILQACLHILLLRASRLTIHRRRTRRL